MTVLIDFWVTLFSTFPCQRNHSRSIFKIVSSIYDGVFFAKIVYIFRKKTPPELFDRVLSNHSSVFYKKVILKISQYSQENTCARTSFLIKLQAWGLQLYRKNGSDTGAFFCEIFKCIFLIEHLRVTAFGPWCWIFL